MMGAALLVSSCTTGAGAGAYAGSSFGSVLGSAIGGIVGGPHGSDVGTIFGMAGGAVVGGALGDAAEKAQVAYYRALINYNLGYAKWVKSPLADLSALALTTIRAIMSVADKSLAEYK